MNKKIILGIGIAVLAAVFVYLGFLVVQKDEQQKSFVQKQVDEYNSNLSSSTEQKEKEAQDKENLISEIQGIVCWGDDMTVGQGSTGTTYPSVLQTLLKENGADIPVVNMGIADETSLEVLGRAGAIPFVIAEEMTLAGNGMLSEIKLKNINNQDVNPLIHTINPGFNPVEISGIQCTLYGQIISSVDYSLNVYYLSRTFAGEDTVIPKGTIVVTDGSKYKDYVNIICIGQHGGFTSTDEMIKQLDTFIGKLGKNKDKYLVLSYINENEQTEARLAEKYAEHYVNVRDYIVKNGLSDANIAPTEQDSADISQNKVPSSLRFDEENLNDKGYTVLGNLVYNKLSELKYLDIN